MTNNPDEHDYDIVEDDDAPLKAKNDTKPKRKPKVYASGVPWRWVIPTFFIGLGAAALVLFGMIFGRVSAPVPDVVQMAVPTATPLVPETPLPLQPSPTPPPFPVTSSPGLAPAPAFGGRIEDIAWHGNDMIVARSNPARLDRYDYSTMNYLGEIKPFNFTNDGADRFVALAVDPSGQHLASINTTYMFSSGDILAEADLAWYTLDGQGGQMNTWMKTHSASDLNNGNPAIPHLDTAVAFAPNGLLMATGAGGAAKGDGRILLWDTQSGGLIGNGYMSEIYVAAMGTVELAFTADSHYLTAIIRGDDGDENINCIDCGSIMIFDVSNPIEPSPLWDLQQAPHYNLEAVEQADISDDGRYLAIPQMGNDRVVTGIELWELPTMRQIGLLGLNMQMSVSEIKDIDLSDDGQSIAFVHYTKPRPVDAHLASEQLTLYIAAWTTEAVNGFDYEMQGIQMSNPLYIVGFFLHLNTTIGYVYYIDPLYGVLNRINLTSGEQTQMMQL